MSRGAGPGPGPRRIVHVVDVFAPRVGGIETQVRGLADHQARAGAEVHVLTATAAAPEARTGADAGDGRRDRYRGAGTLSSGVRVHRFASPLTLGLPVHPREQTLLDQFLGSLPGAGDTVVHAHAGAVSPFAYAGLAAATGLGLPTVVTWHSVPGVLGPAVRAGGARADAPYLATSVSRVAADAVASALGESGLRGTIDERVGLIPNGLDVAAWRAAADEARRLVELTGGRPRDAAGTLRLVATQRLAPRKRARALVATVLALDERLGRTAQGRPRVSLTVAGEGRELPALESMAAGREDVVRLLGGVDRRDLVNLYARRDVFVAPARLEAFGIAALEARAAGLPVLTPQGSGPAELISDRVDGRVARPADGRATLRWKRYGRHVDADLAQVLEGWITGAQEWRLLARHALEHPPTAGWVRTLDACRDAYARARDASR